MAPALRTTAFVFAFLALATSAIAGAGDRKNIAVGNYQAVPKLPADQTFTVGVFSMVKQGAKRRIVASERFAGIFYPDAGECDDLDVALSAESIPVSRAGRFHVREKTPTDEGSVRVNWKGHWSKPGIVAGAITIRHAGCRSTHRWRGGKVAPVSAPVPD